jgi:flagellar basal body-associated protein FliL
LNPYAVDSPQEVEAVLTLILIIVLVVLLLGGGGYFWRGR